MRRSLEFASAACAYTLLWTATRWPAIRANVLFFDDFAIPFHPADFYIGPYRPTLYLEYLLRELIAPNSLWTVTPKVFGAIYIGIAAATLIELLRAWEVPPFMARLLPLIVVSHPLLADGPLWQTYVGLPIVPALITAGAIAWTHGRRLLFTLLTLAGILGYQIYLTLAIVYALGEPVVRRRFRLRETVLRIAIICGCVVMQLAVTALIRRYYVHPDPRGMIAAGTTISQQIHGAFDLLVNTWMPIIAYYTGALSAMSLWKYVPVVLGAATAMVTRRLIPTIFAATIFVIPALPNLALSGAPYSWRVSTPEVYALALALLPLLMNLRPNLSAVLIAIITMIMLPVSWYESWTRVESWERDQAFVASIAEHWRGGSFIVVLAPVNAKKTEDVSLIGPHDLTWGYERRTPRMWSEFNDPWMAKRYVENYAHMKFIDCHQTPEAEPCSTAAAACAGDCNDAPVPYPRARHDERRRITIVCPIRVGTTRCSS